VSNGVQRRSSLFAGLLLILLGVIFLINRYYPEFGLGHLIRLYWPVLVIVWGVTKLVDHYSAQKSGEPHPPLLSGGEAALLILLALVLATFVFRDWLRHEFPGVEIHLPGFERAFLRTRSLPPIEIPAGTHVTVDTARGDIKIVGVNGNELRVSVHTEMPGETESPAQDRLRSVNAVIDRTGDVYRIHPADQNGWGTPATVDFEIQVPKTAPVTASTSYGDINAEGTTGELNVRTQNGDIRIQNVGAGVFADSQKGDVRIRDVQGSVQVRGGGEDVEISDVTGDVSIDGTFLGDTKVGKAGGALRVKSPRADVSVARLAGDLALDSGDLTISGATGLVKVTTRDKDVSIQGPIGQLEVADSHGDIDLRFTKPPAYDVGVTSDSGNVELALPGQSSFQLAAVSRSGDVHCEFEGPATQHGAETDAERINGYFQGAEAPPSAAAPKISIATSYGSVKVKKSK